MSKESYDYMRDRVTGKKLHKTFKDAKKMLLVKCLWCLSLDIEIDRNEDSEIVMYSQIGVDAVKILCNACGKSMKLFKDK